MLGSPLPIRIAPVRRYRGRPLDRRRLGWPDRGGGGSEAGRCGVRPCPPLDPGLVGPGGRAGASERCRRALLIGLAGARSGASALRFGIRSRHWAGVQGTALRHWLPASRPNRVCCRAVRDFAWQRRHDARRCNIAHRPCHDAPVAQGCSRSPDQRADRIARASDPSRAPTQFRNRRAPPRGRGLNPHAGEGGNLGREEIEIIEPAIAALAAEGWRVTGPLPADTMFHARARSTYDAALCMYHDQALIPIKAIYFEDAVNVTLGLPIVRTAPDHGTAFDIAGRDRADARPMAAAIRMAAECSFIRAESA